MITILLILMAYSMQAADISNNDALLLRLLAQEGSSASSVNQGNNSATVSITEHIKDKQAEIEGQWCECACQATTTCAAGIIFGSILYPTTLHVSIPCGLFLGMASSVPHCGILSCFHCYGQAKKKRDLNNLIQQYQPIRTPGEMLE